MATRVKMLKLLQEMRGFAEVTNRRRITRHPGLLTIQLRSPALQAAKSSPRRTIPIAVKEPCDIPHPVRIIHIKSQPAAKPAAKVG